MHWILSCCLTCNQLKHVGLVGKLCFSSQLWIKKYKIYKWLIFLMIIINAIYVDNIRHILLFYHYWLRKIYGQNSKSCIDKICKELFCYKWPNRRTFYAQKPHHWIYKHLYIYIYIDTQEIIITSTCDNVYQSFVCW